MANETKTTRAVKAATTQEKPAAEPKPFLPNTVERIAAAVANILTYGSSQDDLERLVLATVSWETANKSFRSAYKDLNSEIGAWQRRLLPRMLQDLAEFRVASPDLEDKQDSAAMTIAERIRRNSRHLCATEVSSFLANADPEEIRFLYNVLTFWGSRSRENHELSIATAFFDEIDRNVEVLRVPSKHSAAVSAYITALMKAESKGVSEPAA